MFVKGITSQSALQRAHQSWRGLCARVRRDRAALMLGVLLALSVGEPLLCIAHCDLWLPFLISSAQASPHQGMHHSHAQMASNQTPAATAGVTVIQRLSAPEGASLCALPLAGDSSVPFHVPPSPVHELTLAGLAIVLVALALSARQRVAPPYPPPARFYRPLLRPPICSAA